ncbi:hypothetical protein ElyMa_007012600 [Elysia marginata]|uniref:SRCR domain-containing protein n=1 Tax=Elysia marginata TaxID=1093978 RepID=A0AAV4JTX2_9GAST|nr:hypothetical protein ElyMa_007012600 [Elysia marginata]
MSGHNIIIDYMADWRAGIAVVLVQERRPLRHDWLQRESSLRKGLNSECGQRLAGAPGQQTGWSQAIQCASSGVHIQCAPLSSEYSDSCFQTFKCW